MVDLRSKHLDARAPVTEMGRQAMPKRWEELETGMGPERKARVQRRADEELRVTEGEEATIDIRSAGDAPLVDDDDPRSFVGFIKDASKGVSLGEEHDEHLDK